MIMKQITFTSKWFGKPAQITWILNIYFFFKFTYFHKGNVIQTDLPDVKHIKNGSIK